MGSIRHFLAVISALVALLALPALAQASGTDVIRDCNDDGHIDGTYSQAEYQQAEDQMGSDTDQYSDCRDVIAQAKANAKNNQGTKSGSGGSTSGGGGGGGSSSGGSGGGGSGGGASAGSSSSGVGAPSTTNGTAGSPKPGFGNPALATKSGAYAPSQADKAAYEQAKSDAGKPGTLPGGLAVPASGSLAPAGATNSIPLPVMIALLSVGLLALAVSALVARRRLPAVSRVALRLVRR
ncbi:MAG: hypothetical protein QOJ07_1573 [Thermoleophilaceae bacterium]|nr:hypothetical protein [Thermoleophilaceae bacterium]